MTCWSAYNMKKIITKRKTKIEIISEKIADRLCTLSKESFMELIEKHKTGDVALALLELNFNHDKTTGVIF